MGGGGDMGLIHAPAAQCGEVFLLLGHNCCLRGSYSSVSEACGVRMRMFGASHRISKLAIFG